MPEHQNTITPITPTPAPRGFVVDRGDGRAPLPGSLHTNRRLGQWLSLAEPGVVQVFTGKAELGQGILTALQLIVAEELDVSLQRVRLHSASTAHGPDEGVTSGSLSVQDSGGALRHACAQVRAMALQRAAQQAGLQADALQVVDGEVRTPPGSGANQVLGTYWSLLRGADLDVEYAGTAQPKPASARRLLGTAQPLRLDLADKVFGRARYIHDLQLPGMLHGRVLRPPMWDATLDATMAGVMQQVLAEVMAEVMDNALIRETVSAITNAMPAASAEAAPGLRAWADGRFIAVVAARERDADAAAARLASRLQWQPGAPKPSMHELPAFLQTAPCQTTTPFERGAAFGNGVAAVHGSAVPLNVDHAARSAALGTEQGHKVPSSGLPNAPTSAAASHHHAVYFKPYLAHASIGPSCAVALWDGQRLALWTHSQGIHNLRDDIVLALAREAQPVAKADITIHHVEGAGCYGHNGADDVAFDAVLMALRCPGQPVRVLWSRADELAHSPFGAAHLVALQARLDADGHLTHWQHELWANGYSSRPGRASTPTLLAASERANATALPLPINPPLAAGGGADRNAVPAYMVPNVQVINHRLTVMPLRTSAMRALGGYANVFAVESFMDELAHARGEDPLAFRQRHLEDPRALAVLEAVVQRCEWWRHRAQGPEGKPGTPEGFGQGLAWARYKNTGAWCAVLARVDMSGAEGEGVRVLNLDLAVDVGMVVDLDGVINQIEGGAIQSTSWTLKEQVTYESDRITSDGWSSYPILRFSEVPEVRVHVIDRPEEPPLGAGEAAQGPVAAALANAVFDALGVRVRSLPLSPENLLRAVHESAGA
jgi:CO/xanthine dehydrogenase Mo-binding subunit